MASAAVEVVFVAVFAGVYCNRPFPINEMKLLSFVISLLTSRAQRLWSLVGMGCYDNGLGGQDYHTRATIG